MKNKNNDISIVNVFEEIISDELRKPIDEQDLDLVSDCVEKILELRGNTEKLSDEEIKSRSAEILRKADDEDSLKTTKKAGVVLWKRVVAAACIFFVLLSSPIAVKAVVEKKSPFDVLKEVGKTVLNLSYNKETDIEGITFERYSSDHITEYENVEELLRTENIDIDFPTELPEGIYVTSVLVTDDANGSKVSFEFNNSNLFYSVKLFNDIDEHMTEEAIIYHSVTCFYYEINGYHCVQFIKDEKTYLIGATDKNDLDNIINNILEVGK
ncbi:MAG: hypothetical protein ACOX4O_10335 [Eubacteriales bacterium]